MKKILEDIEFFFEIHGAEVFFILLFGAICFEVGKYYQEHQDWNKPIAQFICEKRYKVEICDQLGNPSLLNK
ncbi:MAG TPA: hypothetical protein VLG12_07120 [Candidatus Saccharimonadales bacterium]|nr:hypothetical protein [Candidatus Saccharimonadales bacterium]